MSYRIYHETLSAALDEAAKTVENRNATLGNPNTREAIGAPFQFGGIPYGQTKSENYFVADLNGKKTKKYFHVSIYRMDSGRYELTCYFL